MARANTARKPDTELSEAKRFLTALETGAIRAELIGSNACNALGITARGHAPVLALCQLLIEAGHDPNRPLFAYRGDTLCLRVRSIVEGAALAVENDRRGTPRFRRRRALGDGAAPCIKSRTGGAAPSPRLPPVCVAAVMTSQLDSQSCRPALPYRRFQPAHVT